MPDNRDESLESLVDQTGDKPPENGDPAHFGQALRKTVRPRPQPRPCASRQQEGRGDIVIPWVASLRVLRASQIAVVVPGACLFIPAVRMCLCLKVKRKPSTQDLSGWRHAFLTDEQRSRLPRGTRRAAQVRRIRQMAGLFAPPAQRTHERSTPVPISAPPGRCRQWNARKPATGPFMIAQRTTGG